MLARIFKYHILILYTSERVVDDLVLLFNACPKTCASIGRRLAWHHQCGPIHSS
jgi:hypothetical protein